MKKNRKIIPAILLIATTAFASFACKYDIVKRELQKIQTSDKT